MESQVEEVGSNFEDGSPGLCGKALRQTPLQVLQLRPRPEASARGRRKPISQDLGRSERGATDERGDDLAVFVGRIFEIEVSTVRMNREQKPIAPRAAILTDSQWHSEYNFTTQQPTNPPTHYAPTSPRMWGLRLKGSLANEFAGSTAAAAGVESRSNLVGCQLRNRQLGDLRKGW
jgi:hypothetical protein